MKAITVRNIPLELQQRLEKEAADQRTSLNKTVLGLLMKATGLAPEERGPTRYRDLSRLAGTWTAEEADQFDQALAEQRQIDPELWE